MSSITPPVSSHDSLYTAVYSGVPVYELLNPKSSVMRRRNDGWINATHILKVADFPKAKRTRILEKDVQIGLHEKVQGGYGKYQGTWVPMERAIEIAKEFKVFEELIPIFDYRSTNGANSPPPAPKHHHASSGANKKNKQAKEVKDNKDTKTTKQAKETKNTKKQQQEKESTTKSNSKSTSAQSANHNNSRPTESRKITRFR
ncbi:unnamed protein product [[Candida] boidinii]|nr:unnamed protein product [[Candida] boidinii]